MDVRVDYTERLEVDDAEALTAEALAVMPKAWRRQVYHGPMSPMTRPCRR